MMHYRFDGYVAISGACARQFYACVCTRNACAIQSYPHVCISVTLAQLLCNLVANVSPGTIMAPAINSNSEHKSAFQ